MKISKKTIDLISGGLSTVLIGSTAMIGLSLINKNNSDEPKERKPMNRGDNYEHYKISYYLSKNEDLKKIISIYVKQDKYSKEINETKFVEEIKAIIKNIVGNIEKFKYSINKYKFELSYRINSNKDTVLIDLVWYIPITGYQKYYYDQFKISLSNT